MIGVEYGAKGQWAVEDSLAELAQLAETAGVEVVGTIYQKLDKPHPATFIGKGKLEEVDLLKDELHADVLIFDDELSPNQLRNIEERISLKVIDRTALILDIFAARAQTQEARLQVELAQMEYRLPRLTRMWTHLARQGGGAGGAGGGTGGMGVGLRGPGETQLEVDRREIGGRIAKLKVEIAEVHKHRELYRQRRKKEGLPVVALVGYTNAGKSTLLNKLTAASVLAEDKLFATLDPTTRQLDLPLGRETLLTDTVGFIQRLPTMLVAAFRATLEEISEADVLVHVLDITHPNAEEQARTVQEVLKELKVDGKPRIVALNKIDLLEEWQADGTSHKLNGSAAGLSDKLVAELGLPGDYVPISAQQGLGLDNLKEAIATQLDHDLVDVRVMIPYAHNELVSIFHQRGRVAEESYGEAGVLIVGKLPSRYQAQFQPYAS